MQPSPRRTAYPHGASRPFLALTIAFALSTCASYAVIVNLVPLMTHRGISIEATAVALGLGGASQVVGRLGYGKLVRHIGVVRRTVLVLAGVAVITALLGLVTSPVGLIVVAILAGVVRGIMTFLHATAITERWGSVHYGHLNGVLSAPSHRHECARSVDRSRPGRVAAWPCRDVCCAGGVAVLAALISAGTTASTRRAEQS